MPIARRQPRDLSAGAGAVAALALPAGAVVAFAGLTDAIETATRLGLAVPPLRRNWRTIRRGPQRRRL